MHNAQFYVSGKRPMWQPLFTLGWFEWCLICFFLVFAFGIQVATSMYLQIYRNPCRVKFEWNLYDKPWWNGKRFAFEIFFNHPIHVSHLYCQLGYFGMSGFTTDCRWEDKNDTNTPNYNCLRWLLNGWQHYRWEIKKMNKNMAFEKH